MPITRNRLAHRFYLLAQWWQSRAKRDKDPGFRTLRYFAQIRDWMPGLWPWPEPILCLGPRNAYELGYLRKACGADCGTVVGLDLFSTHPDILVGDMHDLKFPDDSFGLVWASHVLEHARDLDRVIAEVRRVVRHEGWIFAAYPTDFKPTWHDRHDIGHPRALLVSNDRLLFAHYTRAGASAEWSGLIQVRKR